MKSPEVDEGLPTISVGEVTLSLLIFRGPNLPCSELARMMTSKSSKSKQQLEQSLFLRSGDAWLTDVGTEKVRQVLRKLLRG